MENYFNILVGLILLGFVYNVIYLSKVKLYVKYMKTNHAEKWKELGEFSLFANNSPSSTLKFLKFTFSDRSIDDPKLLEHKELVKKMLIGGLSIFGVIVVLFAVIFINAPH